MSATPLGHGLDNMLNVFWLYLSVAQSNFQFRKTALYQSITYHHNHFPEMTDPPRFTQFRIARPTASISAIRAFYGIGGLNLPEVGSFENHSNYSGVMFGLPDRTYHLEFTEYTGPEPQHDLSPPSKDNLLVFFVPDLQERDTMVERLLKVGGRVVEAENPYWRANGVTLEDPDGWRVVLMNTPGLAG